jgi:hypothetical protein
MDALEALERKRAEAEAKLAGKADWQFITKPLAKMRVANLASRLEGQEDLDDLRKQLAEAQAELRGKAGWQVITKTVADKKVKDLEKRIALQENKNQIAADRDAAEAADLARAAEDRAAEEAAAAAAAQAEELAAAELAAAELAAAEAQTAAEAAEAAAAIKAAEDAQTAAAMQAGKARLRAVISYMDKRAHYMQKVYDESSKRGYIERLNGESQMSSQEITRFYKSGNTKLHEIAMAIHHADTARYQTARDVVSPDSVRLQNRMVDDMNAVISKLALASEADQDRFLNAVKDDIARFRQLYNKFFSGDRFVSDVVREDVLDDSDIAGDVTAQDIKELNEKYHFSQVYESGTDLEISGVVSNIDHAILHFDKPEWYNYYNGDTLEGGAPDLEEKAYIGGSRQRSGLAMASLALTTFVMAVIGSMR